MEPLSLEGLPDDALLLIDTTPIVYSLERHPTLGPYVQPLFDAHGGLSRLDRGIFWGLVYD